MFGNNPYAQGGWANAANPLSINNGARETSTPQPSMLGALPFPGRSTYPTICFTFTSNCILNSVVEGPSAVYFRITTNSSTSVVEDAKGHPVSMIDWSSRIPTVEIRDVTPKLLVSQWLNLSADRRARSVEVRGKRYDWTPEENHICLYTHSLRPELVARISRSRGISQLEISTVAVQIGLLEAAIVSTLLMQCGRNID